MKNRRMRLLGVTVLVLLAVCWGMMGTASARWVLYDNFDSGTIDPNKWDIEDSSATISIENGKAKFVHNSGFPGDSSYLLFKTPVKAIRATIYVESCTGDVRARLLGINWLDKVGYEIIQCIFTSSNDNSIYHYCGAWDPVNLVIMYELLDAAFPNPILIVGGTYTVEVNFSSDLMYGAVDGLGKVFYKPEVPLFPTSGPFFGIGTRSTLGDGPCTVYFDDVYVKY